MDRNPVRLTDEEIQKLVLTAQQDAAIRFLNTKPGLMPSGQETPPAVTELIEIGLVKEGAKIVGLEGESQSDFFLTPAGEIWLKGHQ